jgi:hypothetical protein
MNQVGEEINTQELLRGRELNCQELVQFLLAHRAITWSWAIRNFINGYNMFLRFTVSGHHHKGHVYIALNGLDLFDIYLTTNRGTIKQVINDIYIEDLVEILDRKIEKIDKYRF